MNRNKKIYPFYRMFSYDYLFYYVISFLFFTITKGISIADIMFLAAFSAIFSSLFEIPAGYILEKIGLKKSMALGNLMWIIHILIIIFTNSFVFFVIAEAICSFGTCLKSLSETQLLSESLKEKEEKDNFSKIEGKGVSWYFYLEAIASLFVGTLFQVNNYIPLIFTLTFALISLCISLFFEDNRNYIHEKASIKEIVKSFKIVVKSRRLVSIFVFSFLMSGLIMVVDTIQKSTIVELNVNAVEYSLIFAISTLFVGIGASFQYKIEKVLKRRTLKVTGFIYAFLILIIGLINIFIPNKMVVLSISILIIIIQNLIGGENTISMEKYLNNFTTFKTRSRILSAYYILDNLGMAIFLFIGGIVIDNNETSTAAIYIGIFSIIAMTFVIAYMKDRLGKNPEEYTKEDILGLDIKKI